MCPLLQIYFCFVMKDFILSIIHENQVTIIEAFNSTSRYLNNLLNIDNEYFEQMVDATNPKEIQ